MTTYLAPSVNNTARFNNGDFDYQDQTIKVKDFSLQLSDDVAEVIDGLALSLTADYTNTVDLEANYVSQAYLDGASVSIGNATSSVVTIADTAYANTATTTVNPAGSRLVSKAPLLLPAPYSSNWTNVPLIMSGFQTITNVVSTSAYTGTYPTFYVYKLGSMIYFNMTETVFSTLNGANTAVVFDFSGYPEIYPRATITEPTVTLTAGGTYWFGYFKFDPATGLFSIYKNYTLGTFSESSLTVYNQTLVYMCKSDGYGY